MSLYSMHPGFSMEERSRRILKERTGRTLQEWSRLVKKSGPPTASGRREWLKTRHGLTTSYAAWVVECAEGKGTAANYDPEALVEAMFTGPKATLRPLYDRLLDLGLSAGKEVKACPCATIVPLYRRHVFAQIKPATNTRIDMGFALKEMKPVGRLIDTGGFAKKDRITHRIPVTSASDINDEVKRWLKRAYEMDA